MRIKVFATFFVIFAISFNSIINRVSGETNNEETEKFTEESEEIAYQKLLKMEKGMKDSIKKMVDQALPSLMNSNSSIELSGPCMGSIFKIIGALKKMRLWPFEMLDAIGKPAGGALSGTISALGSYQQCIDIVIPTISQKNKPNVGQYCLVEVSPPLPPKPHRIKLTTNIFPHINATFKSEMMKYLLQIFPTFYRWKFTWGVCLPSTCTIDDLNQVLLPLSSQTGLEISTRSCEIKEPVKMDILQIAIVSTLCILIVVNILSTLYYEIQLYKIESNQIKPSKDYWFTTARYFSIRRNFVKLMRTREATPKSLDAINGIKFVTMMWVVLCHSYINTDPRVTREFKYASEYAKDFAFQVVMNGFLSISTFLFITAVLLAYNVVKRQDAGKTNNHFILYFRRCYRVIPILLLVIGFNILMPLIGSGPLFKENVTQQANICREYWWRNLLFIQNFFHYKDMCEVPTWYLAADIQCFNFGLLYLFILYKNEATAKVFLALATLGSCAGRAYINYINDFPPANFLMFINEEFIAEYLKKVYHASYQYISIYSVGLFLGTYMARASKIQINKFIAVICWMVSFAMGITIVYSVHPWSSGEPYTMLEALSYAALNRLGWGIAVGWVVLACFSGQGGIINDFLSWPGFQPLVRLSYIVYLVNSPVYVTYLYTQHGVHDSTHTAIVFKYLGCLIISHIIAVFIRVLYEYPLLKIEDDAFKWFERRQAANEKGRTMSVDLHNDIAINSEMRNDDVKLNKVIFNGVQFTTENDVENQTHVDTELKVETENETSLEDNHNEVIKELEKVSIYNSKNENNERINNEMNETNKLNCS